MYFDLSEEQKQFADSIDRLLDDVVDLNALTKGPEAIAPVFAKVEYGLAALGVGAVMVSQAKGGLGMGLLTLTVAAGCMGRKAAPGCAISSSLAAWLVSECGDDSVIGKWLEPLMSGAAKAAFALNEGSGVWAPDEWRATSKDAKIVKHHVVDADAADVFVVALRDGLAFVPRGDVEIVGAAQSDLDMTRPSRAISFAPGAAQMTGPDLSGRLYDAMLVLAAADAAGAGRQAFQMAVDYAKVRQQFGRVIGSFQGLKYQLADMAVDIEPAVFLCWYAAHAWDGQLEDGSRMAALAKAHAADVAVKTARASVEAHGGIGYTWEYSLHMLLKRAMHDRFALGSSAGLRRRVASHTPAPAMR
jgi:alkylation response protein AidB-like acyl-CoA dehydrogenase